MNKELLKKAKTAKSPEELIDIAKENGTELTEESAKAYFELLHPKIGEISDDELENVSGGGCYKGDRLVVTVAHLCTGFTCKKCGGKLHDTFLGGVCDECGGPACCNDCIYCTYEKGLWLCNKETNKKD